jgi:hypothetical protein
VLFLNEQSQAFSPQMVFVSNSWPFLHTTPWPRKRLRTVAANKKAGSELQLWR